MNNTTLNALNPAKYRAWIDYCAAQGINPLPEHSVTPTGCWFVPNKPQASGYIAIYRKFNGNALHMRLHTLSLLHSLAPSIWRDIDDMLAQGKHPAACHKPICGGNKACFNPQHLRLDDDAGNVSDTIRAGNKARGERNGRTKLTAAQVNAIRQEHSDGATQASLARKYGVSQSAIRHIIRRTNWAHSDGRLL